MGTSAPTALQGKAVRLRPATATDATRLAEILTHPDVAVWWPDYNADRVRRDLLEVDDGYVIFAVEVDETVIGLVQHWEENDPEYRHAGIDIALDPAWHGRGLGADAVRTVARHLFAARGHHRVVIDPATDNARAIRSYERIGFRPVGVMRRYARAADGTWRDGLLMDLLPEELR